MPFKRTTLVWIHGIGNSQADYAEPLKKRLFEGFDKSPEVLATRHHVLWYEDINDEVQKKIKGIDLGISNLLQKAGPFVPEGLAQNLRDVLGDIFEVWMAQGAREWIFSKLARELTEMREKLHAEGIDPKEHNVNLLCHSLGTFVAYEFLHWAKERPGVKVQDLAFQNVFYMAAPIQAMKSIPFGRWTNELAVAKDLGKPYVESAATGAKLSNVKKAWSYRHKHDPVSSAIVAEGAFLDGPPAVFDKYHTGPLMHDWENHLKEFQEDVLTKIYGVLPARNGV